MGAFKTIISVCAQNFRKWKTDYRIWTIAVLLLVVVWIYIDDIQRIATGLHTSMTIWIYPFLYSQFHTKLIFTLPIVLLFCNAPFIDGNQTFVYMRTGAQKWLCGQILYVFAACMFYYIFLLAVCLVSTIISGGELSLEWGKTLTTTANTNAAAFFESPFIYVSPIVTTYFTPFNAVFFTFLLSWLCAVVIGLMIFFCNILTGNKIMGITITSLLIVLSALVDSGQPELLPFSPISWNTIDKLDVGGYTTNPTYEYCMIVYLVLIISLIIGIVAIGKQRSINMEGK